MRKNIQILVLTVILLISFSCNKEFDETIENQTIRKTDTHDYSKNNESIHIILGEKKEIAYTVKNMQNAIEYINTHRQDSKYKNRRISPTHYYIKFMPSNEEHLSLLDEIDRSSETIVLSSYPLDYEIIQQGSFLEKSNADDIKFSELYTTVPIDYIFPNVPYEIIEKVYEPKDIEGDLEIVALVLSGNEKDIEINYKDEPLTINNLSEFLNDTSKGRWSRYRPYGYFKVWDTNTSSYVGVRNTKISIGRGIWWRYTYTNSIGKFVSPKKYRGTVYIRAKWRSESATIRKHWNEVIGIGVSDYLMHIKKSNNGRWYLTRHSDNHKWYKATVQNSIIKYNIYIEPKGVTGVHGANIWVLEGSSFMGSTVMMKKYTWSTTYNAILADWLPWLSPISFPIVTVLNVLVSHLYPDITFTLNDKNTKRIDQIVFHESGHFSHASKAGSSYWGTVVNRELDNILDCDDPYCDGNDPSAWSGRLIALVEGWGTFTEYKVMAGYYTTDWQGNNIVNYIENFDMYVTPDDIIDDNRSWFLTGLIWDIIDNSTENGSQLINRNVTPHTYTPIIDNLQRGDITGWYAPVFNRLTSSVDNGNDLKIALRNTYPSSTNQINQLFESYGY